MSSGDENKNAYLYINVGFCKNNCCASNFVQNAAHVLIFYSPLADISLAAIYGSNETAVRFSWQLDRQTDLPAPHSLLGGRHVALPLRVLLQV